MKQIVVLGSNFAGATAALEMARAVSRGSLSAHITVVAPTDLFLYVPSLIWLPFGRRKLSDISFKISPVFQKRGISFIQAKAIKVIPEKNEVILSNDNTLVYDELVVASGVSLKMDVVSGMEHVHCIVTPPMAQKAYDGFQSLIKNPGPVVIGATQGASCMGAAYEFLFNMEKELRNHHIRERVSLTWITPEPSLGHFGIGGITGGETMLKAFMKMFKINYRTNAKIDHIEKNKIVLASGESLPFAFSMLIPPFEGAEVMKNSPGLIDEKGFLPCHNTYQSKYFKNIYAAGLAVQVENPFKNCIVPFGVPKTGFPSDVQGKIVAHNIVTKLSGHGEMKEMPFGKIPGICIMDAGSKEVVILTDHLFRPRRFEIMIPNIFLNIGKLLLEKYMIFKNRHGMSWLP